jgi:hypothetical protein
MVCEPETVIKLIGAVFVGAIISGCSGSSASSSASTSIDISADGRYQLVDWNTRQPADIWQVSNGYLITKAPLAPPTQLQQFSSPVANCVGFQQQLDDFNKANTTQYLICKTVAATTIDGCAAEDKLDTMHYSVTADEVIAQVRNPFSGPICGYRLYRVQKL